MLICQHLTDTALPAHALETSCSQNDGSVVIFLIQLLQTSIQVASLFDSVKDLCEKLAGTEHEDISAF